jgi:hypothetical protein
VLSKQVENVAIDARAKAAAERELASQLGDEGGRPRA